ncbi:MAG TPA: translation initiation factor IF-2 subunit beta [Methanocorpusculum sp.]|nr:translation initiation factor IF-2 subunit beta [Methanocorpusculum sp.]HJJ56029.1 translation initiation factor IF-2 subunit beta [Methanocorpusculum sp.]
MVESYEKMIKDAYSKISVSTDTGERFVMPKTICIIEGKNTVLENFAEIADSINRDQNHLMKYILSEIGTAGKIENNSRAVFNGKFKDSQVDSIITTYVNDYVICSECGRPDTKIVKDGRVLMLLCEACGSKRPIRRRKPKADQHIPVIEEGKEIEVHIDSISKKGDGVATIGKYNIYVSGTKVGQNVKVKITKISGSVVFTQKTL